MTTRHYPINLIFLLMPIIGMGFEYSNLADAVAVAESNTRYDAVGDSGKARGAWQMWSIAWKQVNEVRAREGKRQYPWAYAHDKFIGKEYAVGYLRWCGSVLERDLGRKPEYWEVYAAFARGPKTFKAEHGYSYDALPARTKRAIGIIAAQMREIPPR